jgi:dihydrolipoamide dehydrogenase
MQYDVAVIGGGPGGYVAAIKAAQKGKSVALIEKNKLGGTCLNVGCIPTKFLLNASGKYAGMFEYADIGINPGRYDLDFGCMMDKKEAVVNQLVGGIEMLMRKNRIAVIRGAAAFADAHTLRVARADGEETLTAENVIIATGSEAQMPSAFGFDGQTVCSSSEALSWREAPDALLVIGGGVVGCELATVYANLGSQVTVVEMMDRLLPGIDAELGAFAERQLKKREVQVFTATKVESIRKTGAGAAVTLSDGSEHTVDKVIVSIGRSPSTGDLGLVNLGVAADRGRILVDDHMRTNVPGIYAIGDACSSPYDLAHTAMKEGVIAAENIAGGDARMDYSAVPSCVYTQPEIATVGLAQREAEEKGLDVATGRFSFIGNGKAVSMGEAEGFIKVVADKGSGVILGAQMAGPHVTDIIAQMAIAVQNRMTVSQVTDAVFAHPTLSEALWEALEGVFGKPVHG